MKRKRILILIFTIYSLALFLFASLKHILLGSSAWDLGIFEQFSWLIANRNIDSISSLRGIAPLQDHFSLILIPIAYIYKLVPSTLTLLAIQSIGIASIPILAATLIKTKINSSKLEDSLIFCLLLSPVLFLANIANFHPEVVSVPIMLITLSEVDRKRSLPYYISLILSLMAKKAQVLFSFGAGIYCLFKSRYIKGGSTILISILWWSVAENFTNVGGDYIKDRLGYLGESRLSIINSIFTEPWKIFSQAPPETIILYSIGLMLPFIALLSRKACPALISMFPIYFLNIISSAGSQRELYSQYSISILPFFVAACWDSIKESNYREERNIKLRYRLTIFLSIISFIGYSRIGYFQSRYFPNFQQSIAFHEAKSVIDKNASVLTSENFAAHFANRESVRTIEDGINFSINKYDYIFLPMPKNELGNDNKIQNIISTAKEQGMSCLNPNIYHVICSNK